ncbi:MAG: cache domain-containing protein [Candidatus Parcubacteria bacterium]|nr:cache domain-containing protein [Candidatus Parcubacteria bacterium]
MDISFWLNNLHFALEFFGAIILFTLAWLSLDAYFIKRELKTLTRTLGFLFFAFWGIAHSLAITSDFWLTIASFSYISGLFLIFFNLFAEKPPSRPKFEAVFILPAVASILWIVHIAATILLILIAALSFIRYQKEFQKTLRPFWMAFSLLALSSILSVVNAKTGTQGAVWILENIIKFTGFIFLGFWGWQYMKTRIREEMLLIFVGMALLISVIVTLTFSAILLGNMEKETEVSLISNVKVMEFTFLRMKNESLSNAQIFAKDEEIKRSLAEKDFGNIEEKAQQLMAEKSMDFLTIADSGGEVILRSHSLTSKGDNIGLESAGKSALAGNPYATIEPTETEKLSIRGAAPVYDSKNNIIGAVVTGFIIDNAFVDRLKKATNLEIAIYLEDAVQATTIFDPIGKTRNTGAKQTDQAVIKKVLEEGQGMTLSTMIFSRPYLAAYLPLKNTEGKTIGMIQASRLQTELADTAVATNRLTLSITIIIVIMMLLPAYWITKKITEEI